MPYQVQIPPALHRKLKARADADGTSIAIVVREILEAALTTDDEAARDEGDPRASELREAMLDWVRRR